MAIDCAGYADFATIIYNIFGYNTYPIKIPDHTATMVKVGNKLVVLDINYINKLTDLREWIKEVEKTPWVGCGNNVSSMFNLGLLLQNLKRYEEAEKECREAIKIDPNDAGAHYNLGILLQNLKRYEEAVNEYRKVIEINPDYAYTHNNLGNLLQNLKRYEEAENEYREAIKINPDYAEIHNNLGNLLQNLKRYEEAEKEYREAIKIYSYYDMTHNNLGILLKKLKRYEEAAIFLKKAQQINPEFKSELCEIIEGLDKEIRERGGPLAIYTEKTTMTI